VNILTQHIISQSTRFCLCFALSNFVVGTTVAQSNYKAFELNRENNWDSLATEDMNGDGLKDLVFSHFDQTSGREIHIHHQTSDGGFSALPQRIEVKTEIIAVGFADLRSDPGTELLLFANAGVFSLSSMIEGYAGNLKPLLEWELIATVPDLERVSFLLSNTDINNDGYIDLLLPGRDSYGIFMGGANETFELLSQISTASEQSNSATRRERGISTNLGINAEEGVSIKLSIETKTPYQDFIEQWNKPAENTETLLRTENWMPNAVLTKLNDDELLDALYLNVGSDGLGQLNIHYQNASSGFNEVADWTGSIDARGEIELADVNGDKLTDIIRVSNDGNEADARFYINQGGQFSLENPSQVMRFSGYDVRLDFVKLTEDALPILSVNYYTIPVVDAIRNASLNRVQLLFDHNLEDTDQIFNRRPDARIEETFSAANVRGLSEQLSLRHDVDGDGRNDGLYITENGYIAAKKMDSSLLIADEAFWEYIAPKSVFEFKIVKLNEDDLPDLILTHGNSSTVLVALP
jgi:hypothetical protein